MDAVFASKLYRVSTRKDKIRAALVDPINQELVSQLRDYLDPEYQDMLNQMDYKQAQLDKFDDPGINYKDGSGAGDTKDIPPMPSHSGGGGGTSADFGDPSESGSPEFESGEDDDGLDLEQEVEIPSGRKLDRASIITASEYSCSALSGIQLEGVPAVIKGTLNSIDETKGVERVAIKDNECWIYYDDELNMNNVMTAVIETLNAACYSWLTFNRLARSDNAIVFELTIFDTNNEVVSIQKVQDMK